MRSLREQLLYRTTGLVILTLLFAAALLYVLMRAALLAEFDAALLVEARALTSHVERSGEQINVELDADTLAALSHGDPTRAFQVRTRDGSSLARSPSCHGRDLTIGQSRISGRSDASEPTFAFVSLPDGSTGRGVSLPFQPRLEGESGEDQRADERDADHAREPLTIAVARSTRVLESTLRTLLWLLLIVMLAAAGSTVAMMSRVIARGLQPLKSLAHSIGRVGAADLSERIQLEQCPEEVTPVVQRLNELLTRVDRAITHERELTADIAHELRTPLAGLTTTLEVSVTKRREPEAYQHAIGRCLEVTRGMHALIENLLLLARADSHQMTVQREPTDVRRLLDDCWSPFVARAGQRGLSLEWKTAIDQLVNLDLDKLRLVLTNLFENAVTYANDGGTIRVTTAIEGSNLSITLRNTARDLDPNDEPHVFERFWRSDKSRTGTGLHSGLGLALCQRMIELLNGTLSAKIESCEFAVFMSVPLTAAISETRSGREAVRA